MRLTGGELITDLHKEYATVFFGYKVFALLRSLIRVAVCQFLGGDESDVLRQMLDCLRIFVPYLMLHMLDDLEDGLDGGLQGFNGAVFFGDDLLPVPLVYIAGVEVV